MASIVPKSVAEPVKSEPEPKVAFNDLTAKQQWDLVKQTMWVKTWNASRPRWNGQNCGTYAAHRKQAGRPSHQIEKERGIVT